MRTSTCDVWLMPLLCLVLMVMSTRQLILRQQHILLLLVTVQIGWHCKMLVPRLVWWISNGWMPVWPMRNDSTPIPTNCDILLKTFRSTRRWLVTTTSCPLTFISAFLLYIVSWTSVSHNFLNIQCSLYPMKQNRPLQNPARGGDYFLRSNVITEDVDAHMKDSLWILLSVPLSERRSCIIETGAHRN